MKQQQLPTPKVKKKINIKKFVALAKKVRRYMEEEEDYVKQNENTKLPRLSFDR